MRKYIVSLFVAVTAMMLPAGAFAYSDEVAAIVAEMNNSIDSENADGLKEVRYDGSDMILVVDCSVIMSEEEFAMLKEMMSTPEGKKMFTDMVFEEADYVSVSSLLKSNNTGMKVCLQYEDTELMFDFD